MSKILDNDHISKLVNDINKLNAKIIMMDITLKDSYHQYNISYENNKNNIELKYDARENVNMSLVR